MPREILSTDRRSPPLAGATLIAAAVAGAFGTGAQAESYAPWLRQIGLDGKVAAAASWGRGQLIGVIDSGIDANNARFAPGQVSRQRSACAAVTFRCGNGFADDNGHGTAVAAIAAASGTMPFTTRYGGYTTAAGNFIGAAPAANILAQKVLDASAQAYTVDVLAGVRRAVDAGARIVNLSLTYNNDPYSVEAINYAAARGAIVVWAAGNGAQALLGNLDTIGLSAAAIRRLIFAGSVDPRNGASSFTNTPGAGALVENGGTKTAYARRWIMAPGENIVAAYTPAGRNGLAYWTGTSMAVPLVGASLMLLQSTWPILQTQGTAANLLLATALDLGAPGMDGTYGNGLVDLQAAFRPYGPLTVAKANGGTVPLDALSGALIAGGALGNFPAIRSRLANYIAFDGYGRNFSVDLSGLIKTPAAAATLNPLPKNAYIGPKVLRYAGGELALFLQAPPAGEHLGEFGYNADLDPQQRAGYMAYTADSATSIGFGFGTSDTYAYAKALYNDDVFARQIDDFAVTSVYNLAQGGYQFSFGRQMTPDARIAVSYSDRPAAPGGGAIGAALAMQMKLGISYRLSERLGGGLTFGRLEENNSLLGAAGENNSLLAFGKSETRVLGLALGYALSRQSSLLFNAEFAATRNSPGSGDSLFAGTRNILSRAYGASYLRQSFLRENDQLMVSVKQPLRVVSGSVGVVAPSVDALGYAHYATEWNSLLPSGRATDYLVSYSAPLGRKGMFGVQAGYRKDVLNIAGSDQTFVGMSWGVDF